MAWMGAVVDIETSVQIQDVLMVELTIELTDGN